jgi:hypothetical protein
MPEKAKTLSVNANTGAFVQLDPMGGPVFLHMTNNTGQALDVVFGAADATAANATSAAQRYILATGTTPATMITNLRCTPNQTWIRSTTTTSVTSLGVILAW